ncbi:MAG: hypothetical protein GOU99_02800 [Candidatus Altiarchaeota archaeon]|nr:hypothetical protein [Candidatus Altiarchaeota archaeon]
MSSEIASIKIAQIVELMANSSPTILFVCEKIPVIANQLIKQMSKAGSLLIEMFHINPAELVDKHIIEKEQLDELIESKGGVCLVFPLGLGLSLLKINYLMTPEQEAELMRFVSKAHASLMSNQPGI